jgi:hypothetical protein
MPQAGRSLVQFPMWSLDFSIDLILLAAIWPRGRLSICQKWLRGIFLTAKGGRIVKAENLTAFCELIVQKMWEPQRLSTLWASTACYRDSFTFTFTLYTRGCRNWRFSSCYLQTDGMNLAGAYLEIFFGNSSEG